MCKGPEAAITMPRQKGCPSERCLLLSAATGEEDVTRGVGHCSRPWEITSPTPAAGPASCRWRGHPGPWCLICFHLRDSKRTNRTNSGASFIQQCDLLTLRKKAERQKQGDPFLRANKMAQGGKGACCQPSQSELDPQDSHGRRKE